MVLEPRSNPHLIGHEQAVSALERACQTGRLPHALHLVGPSGIGKATLAYRFARALLSPSAAATTRLHLDPGHAVFRQVAAGAHPDLLTVTPPEDSGGRLKGEIGVDAVRTVTSALHKTPAGGGRRILVIDGADLLNRNASNALLKTLEEPRPGSLLILVSSQRGRVLPTLRSRCAELRLGRLSDGDTGAVLDLVAGHLEPEHRARGVNLARGRPGRAIELVESGAVELYADLVHVIGDGPRRPDRLAEVGMRLSRLADRKRMPFVLSLLQELLSRAIRGRSDHLGDEIVAGEAAALSTLRQRLPVDQLAGLWENAARLGSQGEGLNLDRSQVLICVLDVLAGTGGVRRRSF